MCVERLDEDGEAVRRRLLGGKRQVLDQRPGAFGAPVVRHAAGHDMDGRTAGFHGVGNGLLDERGGVGFAAGDGGQAQMAAGACVDVGVDAEQHDAGIGTGGLGLGRWRFIGEMQLDRLEAGAAGRGDAFQQWPVRPEKAEIGGKSDHEFP